MQWHVRMSSRVLWTAIVCSPLVLPAFAQKCDLSGKVTDSATHAVPSARVKARRIPDGKVYSAKTNGDGLYTIPDLKAGDYKIWAVAGNLKAEPVKVTLAPGQTTDLVVTPVPNHLTSH